MMNKCVSVSGLIELPGPLFPQPQTEAGWAGLDSAVCLITRVSVGCLQGPEVNMCLVQLYIKEGQSSFVPGPGELELNECVSGETVRCWEM